MKKGYLFSYILLFLILCACGSHKLALKSDYEPALNFYENGEYTKARKALPQKEKGGFIYSTENLMIDLIHGQPEPEKLLPLAKNLEQRQVTYVTNEAENFFYRETEEGYFPAEHEVIAFHILLGYAFAKNNNKEAACIEARRAGEYLESAFDDRRGRFDHPGMRMWLAGLFTYCNEWEHAKVDLRVAAKQLVNLELEKISELNEPPKHLHLALIGDGPNIKWVGDNSDQLFDLDKVEFKSNLYSEINLSLLDGDSKNNFIASAPSEAWYLRHQERNTAIREILDKSKYMVMAIGASSQAVLHKTGAALASGAMITGGVVLATVIIGGTVYLLIQLGGNCGSGCGELLALVGTIGWAAGETLMDHGKKLFITENHKANKNLKEDLDISKTYRFVRFLPDKIALGVSDTMAQLEQENLGFKSTKKPFLTLENKGRFVHLYQWTP
ncbi:MAG: hypothetical protein KDD58_07535 [Bdellovibrionales bacterium]|nr:hypothetical protein [Bdellovibrionales bacterium]MCB0391125.1 hypothetical protein [Bdellovibrionales bacterium]